jgi:hypothetical protein
MRSLRKPLRDIFWRANHYGVTGENKIPAILRIRRASAAAQAEIISDMSILRYPPELSAYLTVWARTAENADPPLQRSCSGGSALTLAYRLTSP